jgi:hypothetical protein
VAGVVAGALAPSAAAHPHGLNDRVVPAAERGLRVAAATSQTYLTARGGGEIQVSRSSAPDPAGDQAVVDQLGSLLHGTELSDLSVHIGAPAEIAELCGGAAVVACYATDEAKMYLPDQPEDEDLPLQYVIAHEYGHHLAARRSNAPWDALDWGPKHWASAMRVCDHVRAGLLFPGNQGAHYGDDPGEGFADAYARLNVPAPPWVFSALLLPGDHAFAAIRRDVLAPWTGPRTRTFRGRLARNRGVQRFTLPLKLDGDLTATLTARRPGLSAQVELEGESFATAARLGPERSLRAPWCRPSGSERIRITVRRRDGAGRFALRVTFPG